MKSDIPIKRILQVRPEDWVAFLFPDCKEIKLSPLSTSYVPRAESRLDNINFVNNDFIVHIEPNGYLDNAMPARMLRYRADIWEYTLNKKLGTPKIKQVLLLFFDKHDNKRHSLSDDLLDYSYDVIKVWEMDKEVVLKQKLIGLYPLIPLMKNKSNETPEEIIKTTVEVINGVADGSLKNDLFVAMVVLASEKFVKELVIKYIRSEIIMESALLKEWTEEIAKKAVKDNTLELAKSFLEVLSIEEVAKRTHISIDELTKLKGERKTISN